MGRIHGYLYHLHLRGSMFWIWALCYLLYLARKGDAAPKVNNTKMTIAHNDERVSLFDSVSADGVLQHSSML